MSKEALFKEWLKLKNDENDWKVIQRIFCNTYKVIDTD
jgi:hypothetical protein